MKPDYTVNPVEHQPQWPGNDNKEPSLLCKLFMVFGIAVCLLMLLATIPLGLLSMTVAP